MKLIQEKIEDNYSRLNYRKFWISRLELGALLFKISNSKMIESSLTGKTDFIEDDESDNKKREFRQAKHRFL